MGIYLIYREVFDRLKVLLASFHQLIEHPGGHRCGVGSQHILLSFFKLPFSAVALGAEATLTVDAPDLKEYERVS